MIEFMLITSIVLLLAVVSSKLLYKYSVPVLLIFLVLGMLFGSDGIVKLEFDNYDIASKMCSVALMMIMFYGGFGTNWKMAKPIAVKAGLMSSLGTFLTAGITGLFCTVILKTTMIEGLLIGSVLASTDAASVFGILRSRSLNLKGGLASLLEVESGSNDPFSYMLTVIMISIMTGSKQNILLMLTKQIIFGVVVGVVLAVIATLILKHIEMEIEGLYPILATAIVIFGFSICEIVGGNGYLCVYILGIILGNSRIRHKRSLVHFFDGISWLMQILLFFTLGLLSFPSQMMKVIVPALLISVFIILVARPIVTFVILGWFKMPLKQLILISWVGLRGAASIAFAIFAVSAITDMKQDIFHIVFFVALLSVGLQGALVPYFAKKLGLVEKDISVFKTFNDYQDEIQTKLYEIPITNSAKWVNKSIMDANIPDEILIVMIKRGADVVIPNGSTKIKENDVLVLSGNNIESLIERIEV